MVLPILLIDGMSLGIYSSEIHKLVPPSTEKELLNKYAGYLLIGLGTGATVGGFFLSWIGDKVSSYWTGRVTIVLLIASSALFLVSYEKESYWIGMGAAFVWGFFLFFL